MLSGHDEVGGMDIPTELGGVAKGTAASAAGESDFVGAFSKEVLSSIDLRQQLILTATAREKLQDKFPEHTSLVLMLKARIWQHKRWRAEAATPSKMKVQKGVLQL